MFTLIEPGSVTLVATHDGPPESGSGNVMTITWTMAMAKQGAKPIAIATGPCNHSWAALRDTSQCVVAIPTADLIDTVIGVGTTSGAEIDKFARFKLVRTPAAQVVAHLLRDCTATIECRVVEIIERYGIIFLVGLAAWLDPARAERRTRWVKAPLQ